MAPKVEGNNILIHLDLVAYIIKLLRWNYDGIQRYGEVCDAASWRPI